MDLEKSIEIINELHAKYAENPYMLSRTYNYILQLPNLLENINKTHVENQQRIDEMTQEQELFIKSFLNNNQYFYMPSTEKFFYYNGKHYKLCSEDDTIHHVLTTITMDRQLMRWKKSTKIYIMKRIKENFLLKSVPESETIQHVFSLLTPTLFSSKSEVKYFLTLLGDNILRKNEDSKRGAELIHFIDPKAKKFISELNMLSQGFLGYNLNQTIKHKYHEHDYNVCRLIKIADAVKDETKWKSSLYDYAVDILCVACYYSRRYSCSDDFIMKQCHDDSLMNDVLYLKMLQTPDIIVERFVGEYLQLHPRSDSGGTTDPEKKSYIQITWKNMQYLWKLFLESKHLPMIMFQTTLKTILQQRLGSIYDAESDSFMGIASKYLPIIQRFIGFWEETMSEDVDNELEIDEVARLFKMWNDRNGGGTIYINQSQILDLLKYFYPDLEMEDDKYIYKIRCAMWDKQMEIQMAMEQMRDSCTMPITVHEAYNYYCKNCLSAPLSLIVGKSYFEKYFQ